MSISHIVLIANMVQLSMNSYQIIFSMNVDWSERFVFNNVLWQRKIMSKNKQLIVNVICEIFSYYGVSVYYECMCILFSA